MDQNHNPSERWLAEVIELHERSLVAYATRLTGDLHRGRDVVQETFLRLIEAPPPEVESKLREWLFRVCRTRALDLIAKESPMRTRDPERAFDRSDPGPGPDQRAQRVEDTRELVAFMSDLPENQREALELKFRHGLSYAEIAAVTRDSIGQVSWLIHRGLRALRERMAPAIRVEDMEGQV